jgi:hypothetical protein
MIPTLYMLVAFVFTPSDDGGLARADAIVINHTLEAQECMDILDTLQTTDHEGGPIWACTVQTDF